jgi:hypothetical protein
MRPRLYNIAHASPISAKRTTRGFKLDHSEREARGRRLRRCACAANGQTAAPPSSVMKSRRFMLTMGLPRPACPSLPWRGRQVPWAHLKCSESSGLRGSAPSRRQGFPSARCPASVIRNLATLIRWVLGELESQCSNLSWGTVLIANLLS